MSMGMALEGIRDYLRREYEWDHNQCGVQLETLPPATAAQFFIGLDDAGCIGGDPQTDSLKETLEIEIGIWRRAGDKPSDRKGQLKLPHDMYLGKVYTLTDLERLVMVPKASSAGGGLHKNYRLLQYINQKFELPNEESGPGFVTPLNFAGYGRLETRTIEGGSGPIAFYGRKLRFRGLTREQLLRGSRSTTG